VGNAYLRWTRLMRRLWFRALFDDVDRVQVLGRCSCFRLRMCGERRKHCKKNKYVCFELVAFQHRLHSSTSSPSSRSRLKSHPLLHPRDLDLKNKFAQYNIFAVFIALPLPFLLSSSVTDSSKILTTYWLRTTTPPPFFPLPPIPHLQLLMEPTTATQNMPFPLSS
jgi:hypothetical protein